MKSKLICDALNTVNPTSAQKARMRGVLEAQLPPEKPRRRGEHQAKPTPTRWWTVIPAAAALIAVVFLGIFVIGRTDRAAPELAQTSQPLTLQSLMASSNYQASMEAKTYVLSSSGSGEEQETLAEEYRAYGCRTSEMAEKIDEICRRYSLNKVGNSVSADSAEGIFASLGIRSMVVSAANVQTTTSNASYSADGNFEFWGTTTMDDSPWTYPVEYRAYRAMKQTLSTAYWEIGDTGSYEWWNYDAKSGANVLIAAGQDKALLLTDTGDSVVLIVVMNATVGDVLYGEQTTAQNALEAFAETFDFSLSLLTEENPEPTGEIPQVYQPILAKYAQAAEEHWDAETCMALDISECVAYLNIDGEYGYALLDLDGDGTQELFITNGYSIIDMYVQINEAGVGHLLMSGESWSYLCKDNILLSQRTTEEGQGQYEYTKWNGTDLDSVMIVDLDPEYGWSAGQYARAMKGISEEEAQEILDIYPVQAIPYLPIPKVIDDAEPAMPAAYQEVVNKYITAITENWGGEECNQADISLMVRDVSSLSTLGYAMEDLDLDGTDELLIANDGERQVIYDLYSLVDGQLVHVLSGGERNSYELRDNLTILNIGSNSAFSTDYRFYHLRKGRLILESITRFDAEKDPEHPWFRGLDEQALEQITDENWSEAAIYASCPSIAIHITPLGEGAVKTIGLELTDYEDYLSTIDSDWIRFCALRDLDGDGQNELLLFDRGRALDTVAALQNGTPQEILSGGTLYLCEGNILEYRGEGSGGETIIYYRVENQKAVPIECITYRVNTDQWYRDRNFDSVAEDLTPITEEEQQRVVNTYPHVDVETQAILQLVDDDTTYAVYKRLIDTYVTAINEKWDMLACNEADISYMTGYIGTPETLGYVLKDLDGNGVRELLLVMDGDGQTIIDMYTISLGKPVHVFSGGERYEYTLNGENDIMELVVESGSATSWLFYRLEGTALVLTDRIRYDENKGSWSRYFQGDHELTEQPISKEIADEILNGVEPYWIETKPITVFSAD